MIKNCTIQTKVQALQLTNENSSEMLEFLNWNCWNQDKSYASGEYIFFQNGMFITKMTEQQYVLQVTDCVVKYPNDTFEVYTEEEFDNKFSCIEDE